MSDRDEIARVIRNAKSDQLSEGETADRILAALPGLGWVKKRSKRTARLKKAAGKSIDVFQATVSKQRKFKP